jgi:thiamine transport system ATP-binding protein
LLELDHVVVVRESSRYEFTVTLPGQHILLVTGSSGIGKSTLLDTIAGFLQPDSGSMRWNGEPIHRLPPEKRPVTSLFQANNLFEHVTVCQNILLALPKLSADVWLDAASQLGLLSQLDKPPGQLSGGQRQRVALLTTVLRPEPLLLMDEPFSELDAETRSLALAWCMQQFRQQARTVVLVSHQQEDIEILRQLPHRDLPLGSPAAAPIT